MCYETTRNAKTCRSGGVGTPCFVDVRQLVWLCAMRQLEMQRLVVVEELELLALLT